MRARTVLDLVNTPQCPQTPGPKTKGKKIKYYIMLIIVTSYGLEDYSIAESCLTQESHT